MSLFSGTNATDLSATQHTVPRMDYPRPQFQRDSYLNLNGMWQFEFDDNRIGEKEGWASGRHPFGMEIIVPFTFESPLSGLGQKEFHDVVWYRRTLELPADFRGKRLLLHFGAVDYLAKVWVNGHLVAVHEGGHTPFEAEITDALSEGENVVVVRAEDFGRDVTLPRGKQYWREESANIFYTRTTGIWQTVWLEAVSPTYLERVKYTPDLDSNRIELRYTVNGDLTEKDIQLRVKITFKGERITDDLFSVIHGEETRSIHLNDFNDHKMGRWWTPDKPNLYDVEYVLFADGEPVDSVASYFGMRKISVEHGKVCLNNKAYFQRLVLDQGYYPDGNLTPPSDDAIREDVELTKALGFNGVRKHQKLEDPRYLYWCDKLGLLVWSEAANAMGFSDHYVEKFTKEWIASIKRDYNHPCIVAWVPLNESWGVPNSVVDKKQQQHALAMYHLTKSLDQTRPVIGNDGWEMMNTDYVAIHDYEYHAEVLTDRYSSIDKILTSAPCNREILVGGTEYQGQPILVTEFGGIGFKVGGGEGWGYSGAWNEEDFLKRIADVINPMIDSPHVQGFCYTQLTDVEQEINGLLTYDRKPKVPVDKIADIVKRPKKFKPAEFHL